MVSHNLTIHEQADAKLNRMDDEPHDRIVRVLQEVADGKEPTRHSKCEWLDGNDLLKVRVGDYRILVDFDKPTRTLRIVYIGERSTVYDSLDVALQRAQA